MKANVITLTISAGGVMTGTTVITSNPVRLDQIYGYAIQAVYTGSPVGTLKLQASSDSPARQTQVSNGGPDVVTNWTDITDSSEAVSGAGSFMWNVTGCFYNYVRLVYTNASGTGVLTAKLSEKGV